MTPISSVTTGMPSFASIAKPLYTVGQGLFFVAYGAKEFFWDGIRVKKQIREESDSRIPGIWREKFQKVRSNLSDFSMGHGAYYAAMGAFGAGSVLQDLGVIPSSRPSLDTLSWVSFLLANLYGLQENIRLYLDAREMGEHESVKKIKASAIMGILNAFGYCLTASLLLFGGPMAWVIVLGGISVFTGCVKILYDYFALSPSLQPESETDLPEA